jgi:hypothetical protein
MKRLVWSLLLSLVGSVALAQDVVPVSSKTETTETAPADGETVETLEETPEDADSEVSAEPALGVSLEEFQQLKAQVEALQAKLGEQRKDISKNSRQLIPKDALSFDLEGYYRLRAHSFVKLFADQDRHARFMTHRLRLRPVLDYKGLAKLVMQVDALDNVVWGDNESLASTALFAADPSNTNLTGRSAPSVRLSRIWMEAQIPVGSIRAGRMASHWGMGLLANDGNGFDDKFGENYGGNSFDRVLFATRPISVAQAIAGKADSEIPLYAAIGVDRLVEDPLIQFHGYKCESGLLEADEKYDIRCDSDEDGRTDLDHGYTDESRTTDQRGADWWADSSDDVWELIYVLIYRGEDIKYLGGIGDLTAGAYVINRRQRETDSNVWIADVYLRAAVHNLYLEFEGLTIQGTTRAIALPGSYDPSVADSDPLYKKANIWGYTGRLGYIRPDWEVMLEHGYASGDNNVADMQFTGRPLHPDHNVGLLLYDEVIARVTAELWSEDAEALWSQGGVYNSTYLYPTFRYSPLDNWDLLAGMVVAFPASPDGRFIRCREGEGCAQSQATAGPLGWEALLGVKHRWHEHLLFSLETSFAHATDRLPLEAAGLNPKGNFFTLQSRLAYQFK